MSTASSATLFAGSLSRWREAMRATSLCSPISSGARTSTSTARALRTRDDAIRQLEEIADFFRRTEPHSPLAFTLDDAVRRARMSLPDLLAEIMPDADVRKVMLTSLGIHVPRE